MKYTEETKQKIFDLFSTGEYIITEICPLVGISEATFHEWRANKPEFLELLKKANEKRLERYRVEARKSMLKKIQGYTIDEVRTTYIDDGIGEDGNRKPRIKEKTITKKHFQPDTGMIIFALTNTDAENFRNYHQIDHTTKGKELPKPVMFDLNKLPDDLLRGIS